MINAKNGVRHITKLIVCLVTILTTFTTIKAETLEPISGRNLDTESILPADVLARVILLADAIELIRLELGKPEVNSSLETVMNTSPQEVYFQAQTAFIKSNRLLFEQTGYRNDIPSALEVETIKPFHVWQMVNTSYEQILVVKETLNIMEQSVEKEQDINSTPSDVFAQVVLTNKQLNAVLQQQFSPSDVFREINESIHIMAAVLATEPSVKRIPAAAEFVRWKTPTDVYDYLLATRKVLINIMNNYDVKFAQYDTNTNTNRVPSDVYDLATLLVANLQYMHSLKLTAKPFSKTYISVKKTPSDVYQRVSVVHQQLLTLKQLHENNSDWLNQ